ncbi:phospholipase [Streptomyces sp. NBC_01795]|uniref:phospholipase A2 n=1 Tax=unclassified Streptomyces TaxID=2593676 RepID=UPI002DDB83C8|nr:MULTISPECIES: phospholipase A2 [unclassified Streptomyces]WSA92177.1 phospholipase [Streptomyces sp. NBC_01795]WSB76543.1 phospholipase [Streptomyces sp. NBC_01775]WSS15169.1 phospholipase [Streptomyces sp. NBC_01186]
MHKRTLSTAVLTLVLSASALTAGAGTAAAASPGAGTGTGTGTGTNTGTSADATVRQQADQIMNLSYEEFARTPRTTPFNWTTDGCSVPGPFAPYRQVFHLACTQHDFGYRNYGGNHELKLSPTRETKNWIDGRFRTELIRTCENTYKTPLRHQSCLAAADAYYFGVNTTPTADRAFF